MQAPLPLQLPLSAMAFLPPYHVLKNYFAAALSCLRAAVLHCRDRHLFVGGGELHLRKRKEIRMATAPLKTRSVALRYTNLRLPTCGMIQKFGKEHGDLDSSPSTCSSQCLQLQRDTEPQDGEILSAAEGLQHMGSFPEAGSSPSALMMC